jgi:ABC-type Zn uptake system ZnuABC Zn-binding protein ZnuA
MARVRTQGAAVLLAGLVLATGCGPQGGARVGKLKVVATFSVLGDFVRNVAGDRVELVTLVGPDGDAHTFEPAPSDGVALAKADVIFENGVGLEPWLDGLYSSTQSKAERVVLTQELSLLKADEPEGEKRKGGKEEHGDYDPHVWHDAQNAVRMVEAIRDALARLDPDNADAYKDAAADYVKQLRDLDRWVVEQVATVSPANRKLVTNHDTFGYFSKHYGVELLGTALGSLSTETGDPSAASFARLCESIKAAKVPAIFAENVQNPKLMERLAQEAGVRLGPELYTDALGEPGSEGDTYLKMMRHNVTAIVGQLKS